MFSGGAVESLPEFCPNIFSDKSARIFLIFSSLCPNFHGFPKLGCLVRLWVYAVRAW
jgi:hypothetical protein